MNSECGGGTSHAATGSRASGSSNRSRSIRPTAQTTTCGRATAGQWRRARRAARSGGWPRRRRRMPPVARRCAAGRRMQRRACAGSVRQSRPRPLLWQRMLWQRVCGAPHGCAVGERGALNRACPRRRCLSMPRRARPSIFRVFSTFYRSPALVTKSVFRVATSVRIPP